MSEVDVSRWGLLASSLGQRPLQVTTTTEALAWTDGATVHIPADATTPALLVAIQATLLRLGSLDPAVLKPLRGHGTRTREHLRSEGWRAVDALRAELPALVAPLLTVERDGEPPSALGTIKLAELLNAAEDRTPVRSGDPIPRVHKDAGVDQLDDNTDSVDLGRIMRLLSSPIGTDNPMSRLFNRLLGLGRRSTDDPAGGELATGTIRQRRRPGGTLGHVEALRVVTPEPRDGGAIYSEWDDHQQRYRPAWCTVREGAPVAAAGASPLADVQLERAIAHLGLERARARRQRDGYDLDLDGIVDAVVAGRTGSGDGGYVHIDSRRTRRDLGVLVLVDVSGSAAERVEGRSVHSRQMAAAGSLVRELHDVGAQVGYYGFHSNGRHHVQLLRFKGFDETLSSRSWGRAGAVEPAAYTRLGAAIRHATWTLTDQAGTGNRLLVVVSDGFAYDHEYEGRYAEADARRALQEARAVGCASVCLSFGATDVTALRRVFGSTAHATIEDPRQLRTVLPPLARVSLQRAGAVRRHAIDLNLQHRSAS